MKNGFDQILDTISFWFSVAAATSLFVLIIWNIL